MTLKLILKNKLSLILLIFILSSCVSDEKLVKKDGKFIKIIQNLTLNVIIKTYEDLNEEAKDILNDSRKLRVGDELALKKIRKSWREARIPWERSEGFLYGPVDTKGIDPAIDSWPLDLTFLNSVLSGTNAITAKFLASQNNNAKGFHTIEYLLWGINGNKKSSDLTLREIEYLKAASEDLKNNVQVLYDGWIRSKGNFASQFLSIPSENYKSEKNVIQEIVDGISIIADEVANTKIETPLNGNGGQAAPDREESRFAHNSKTDFINNIQSIKSMYLGVYNGKDGLGISDILISKNNTKLDNKIKSQIEESINAINSIPGTFTSAIINNRKKVKDAQQKVNSLFKTLEIELKLFINNNI